MGSAIVNGVAGGRRSVPMRGRPDVMADRARMFRRWADTMPGPAARACRRRACELMLMAKVAAAAG